MSGRNTWLERSDTEIVEGWMAAWWVEARSHVETEAVRRRLLEESDPVRLAVSALVDRDPARALSIAFLIARAAESRWMMVDVGVGILQEVLKADPTLWDAIKIEVATNPTLLRAVTQVWEVDVPHELDEAHEDLVRREGDMYGDPSA